MKALKQCKLSESQSFPRKTYRSVYGVLFFGAPHQGMEVEDIVDMATDLGAQERLHLVSVLEKGSEPLQQHLGSLTSLAGDFRIVSFYERILSRKLEKAEVGGLHYCIDSICSFCSGIGERLCKNRRAFRIPLQRLIKASFALIPRRMHSCKR